MFNDVNMNQRRSKVQEKSPQNSERPMSGSLVDESRSYIQDALDARASDGRKRAIHAVAREIQFTPLTPRRVAAILHGEVNRLWADEYLAIQTWRHRWMRSQRERMASEIEQLDRALETMEQ